MTETRREFFDRIAPQWDEWVDLEQMRCAVRAGLRTLGISRNAT